METVTYIFMIITYGLGNVFAESKKMGAIFPSDIPLLIMTTILLIRHFSRSGYIVRKLPFIAVGFMVFEFIQGLVCGASLQFVMRDFKIWLYFFIPYWSIKELIIYKPQCIGRMKLVFVITIVMTLWQNWSFFFTKGIQGLVNSNLTRSFDYGMSFSCATIISICAIAEKKWLCEKIGYIGYYAIEALCVASVVFSYTRSFWLVYLLTLVVFFILMKINKLENSLSMHTFTAVIVSVVGLAVISYILINRYSEIFEVVNKRFASIFRSDTSGINKNTLSGRIEYLADTLVKFKSPKIILGYGYGDLQVVSSQFLNFRAFESWNCENSVLYYCWKYGVAASVYLFYSTTKKIHNCIISQNKLQIALISYIISWIPIGLMSGNFNSAFPIALFAFLFAFTQYGFSVGRE